MNRVKYPLTPEAQQAAIKLVKAWDSDKIEQLSQVWDEVTGYTSTLVMKVKGIDHSFTEANFEELSLFGLIRKQYILGESRQILLLQELRNAVANDFEVSDYFLTFNAVGTIITGGTINAPFQSAASIYGDVSQEISSPELVDKLLERIGLKLIEDVRELEVAIEDLKQTSPDNRKSQVGKVISELGRCLEHGANTVAVIQGISLLTRVLGG